MSGQRIKKGQEYMGVNQSQIDQAFLRYKATMGGVKQDYFSLLYLSQECGKKMEEVAHQVAFGGNDYGLDAFRVDRERKILFLYQFKWTMDHHQFKGSYRRLIDAGMEQMFGNPLQDKLQNQLLIRLKSEINIERALIDQVIIYFVFNGDPSDAEKSEVLNSLQEDLEAKKYLIDQYFEGRKVRLTIQYVSNQTKKLAAASHTRETHRYPVQLDSPLQADGPDGEKMYICLVPLIDLHQMYREMGQRFFERNIRASLDSDQAPNRSIRDTFRKIVEGTQSPASFVFNHNGVTIAAQAIELGENGRATITEPRLLNGAQTVSSLAYYLDKNEGNKKLSENRTNLDSIRVIAKIICNVQDRFVVNTTICTNRQNPVEPWNLRASDSIQLEIQDRFREGLRLYYERQEKAFKNLRDEELEELDVLSGRAIEIKFLAQTLLAGQGEIDKMSNLREVFESEKIYEDTFQRSLFSGDLRPIVLAYKARSRLKAVVEEIQARGSNKYHYAGNARNLIWALLIQGILNADNLEEMCGQFGEQLTLEADFTSWIKSIASTRIRTILSEVVERGEYSEQLEKEKYSFLRSKAIYSKCMLIAKNRYRWDIKTFEK